MAISRYGGVTGSVNVSEDYENINVAFNNVAAENDDIIANGNATQTDINNHKVSTTAHSAQDITYTGEAVGDNVKAAIDYTNDRIDNLIITGGDSSPEVADARGGYPVLGDRLNASDAQLADLRQLMIASWHGVDSTIGSADATEALNNLFDAAKAAGKRYVYFDDPHTYYVGGDLTNARDLILLGDGAKIKSGNPKNYFINISPSTETFNGKYNIYPEYDNLFKTVATAIKNGAVNVTIWGDSISTGGSDVIGIKYGLNNIGTTVFSPNNLTPSDSYYTRLIDILTKKFPTVTFNFYNRAIGGAGIKDTGTTQTFNGVNKNWMEHIKDTDPDLLLIGFGMNTNLSDSKSFRYYMDQITNYFSTNLTKQPSICWVTTPRPTMALSDDWGSIDAQLSRHMAASCARLSGVFKGGYIIDANRVSDILRTGIDFTRPILKGVDLIGKISGTFTESNGIYSMDEVGETININELTSDFVLEFEANFGTTSGGNLWFGYNRLSGTESLLLILPEFSGKGGVHSFAGFSDVGHFPGVTMTFDADAPWNDGAWRKFRIEKRAEILEVYVDGLRVIRDIVAINNLPGTIHMDMNETGSAVYQFRNLKLYKGTYKQYLPSLTESEMWGEHIDGDYSTKPITGGNGVNHPSTRGLEEVYGTVLREFVEDIAAHRWKYLIM